MIARSILRFIGVVVIVTGCGKAPDNPAPAPPPAPPATVAAPDSTPTIVFAGTSLTAGFGLPNPDLAYPTLLQRKIDSAGLHYRTVNRGISGETSAGLLRRIDWVLEQGNVAVLVVETGANDGLRGQDPDSTKATIQAILDRAKVLAPGAKVVIVGMEAMPNLGQRYVTRFRAIFGELATANGAALVPFLLAGVAGVDSLNQSDGIHPTPRGQEIVAETVWNVLRNVLSSPAPRTSR